MLMPGKVGWTSARNSRTTDHSRGSAGDGGSWVATGSGGKREERKGKGAEGGGGYADREGEWTVRAVPPKGPCGRQNASPYLGPFVEKQTLQVWSVPHIIAHLPSSPRSRWHSLAALHCARPASSQTLALTSRADENTARAPNLSQVLAGLREVMTSAPKDGEVMWCQIQVHDASSLYIGCIYTAYGGKEREARKDCLKCDFQKCHTNFPREIRGSFLEENQLRLSGVHFSPESII